MPGTTEKKARGLDGSPIKVALIGEDGNAFFILGRVKREMRRQGVSPEVIESYLTEAQSGDYDNLLRVTYEYVEIE